MKLEELEEMVIYWAAEKGIFDKATRTKQGLKTLEEVHELLVAIHDNNWDEIKDAIGDIVVTVIIQAQMNGLDLSTCLEAAYNEIKGRKGTMINGTFVKEN